MIRGYAIGLGAGTQAFTHAAFIVAAGPVTRTSKAFAMLAGWLLNLVVAEWVIASRTAGARLSGTAGAQLSGTAGARLSGTAGAQR